MGDQALFNGWEERYRAWVALAKRPLVIGDMVTALEDYPFLRATQTPFTPLKVPLEQVRLGLVTTSGVYLKREQSPFRGGLLEGDPGCREIPLDVTPDQVDFSEQHFEHGPAERDWNVVFPIDRLRGLAAEKRIGGIAAIVSLCGYVTNAKALFESPVPAIVESLVRAKCDAVLVVPVSPICHQSSALVSRAAEEAGIATVEIGWNERSLKRLARPRVLRSPMARFPRDWDAPLGAPGDRATQEALVAQALAMLTDAAPGEVRRFVQA
jgi:D-proline reductase (dithiol) PrdB